MYERTWKDEQVKKTHRWVELAGVAGAAIAGACMITVLMSSCQEAAVKMGEIEFNKRLQLTKAQESYKEFFVKHGSNEPEAMAIAVSHTKNPKLMAAIAVVESNGNPKAVGDSGASVGAFQVQAKHWGKVPNNALGQALQAEKILEEILVGERGRLRQSLACYNGGTRPPKQSYCYADRIIGVTNELYTL